MIGDAGASLRAAGWLGSHATAAYLVVLALLLAAVGAGWWRFDHRRRRQELPRLSPQLFPLVWAGVGFALLVAMAAVFASLADGLGADESMGRLDDAFTAAVQQHTPAPVLHAFAAVTRLGNTATLTAIGVSVAVALLAAQRTGLATAWSLAVAGNALLNVSLKAVFARARPVHEGGLVLADGFSFPSGHASGSVVTWGMLAYLALRLLPLRWHLPALLLAASLALTVGSSRVFLRVHYPSDVLAGFATGTAWLAICIAGVELARRRRQGGAALPSR